MRWMLPRDDDLADVFDATFDEVYRYAARLTGANREMAEDLVQDAYLQLLRAVRASALTEVTYGWLISVVRNRFIDSVRRDKRRPMLHRFIVSDESGAATEALEQLQPTHRLALVLHHVDGYSVKETASMLGKSVRATESLPARARDAAREQATIASVVSSNCQSRGRLKVAVSTSGSVRSMSGPELCLAPPSVQKMHQALMAVSAGIDLPPASTLLAAKRLQTLRPESAAVSRGSRLAMRSWAAETLGQWASENLVRLVRRVAS